MTKSLSLHYKRCLVLTFACILILALQCIYLGTFLYQLSNTRPDAAGSGKTEGISVIVCAHDEEENLRELLPLLCGQDYPEFEIIIVEDRCNDGTFDYLMEAVKQYPRLRTVRVEHVPEHVNGKKFGLTLGIRAARNEWVLLTDADCRPAGNSWVSSMSRQFSPETQIVLGYSAYEKKEGLLNAFIRFETLVTGIQYTAFAWMGLPYMGVGRNLAYRKSLFLQSKGFNSHLNVIGGDDDLFVNEHANAINTRVASGRDAIVYSRPKSSVREFYYQKLRHLSVGKRYRSSTLILLGFFTGSWILTWWFAIPAAVFTPYLYWVLAVALLRWLLFAWLVNRASRRLGDSFEGWKTPFLEFIYTFYYLVAGAVALVSKKVRWKI